MIGEVLAQVAIEIAADVQLRRHKVLRRALWIAVLAVLAVAAASGARW